jgi:hypothetical protein
MIELHPDYITKEGKREYVILPYEEFSLVKELLQNFEDLRDLRDAKAAEAETPVITLEEVKAKLSIA